MPRLIPAFRPRYRREISVTVLLNSAPSRLPTRCAQALFHPSDAVPRASPTRRLARMRLRRRPTPPTAPALLVDAPPLPRDVRQRSRPPQRAGCSSPSPIGRP